MDFNVNHGGKESGRTVGKIKNTPPPCMGFDTDDPDNGADMEIGGYSDRAEIGRLIGVIYGCFK